MELRQRIKMNFKAFWLFMLINVSLLPVLIFARVFDLRLLLVASLLIVQTLTLSAIIFLLFTIIMIMFEGVIKDGKEE